MKKKNMILFDMDGTLTEPRDMLDRRLLPSLRKLIKYADLGIVTGSDIDYLKFQMEYLIKQTELRYCTHLLPCNGTKHYTPPRLPDDTFHLMHEMNMKDHIGDYSYRHLMMVLSERQSEACYLPIPLTGNFISYRGSMINWCPIGRNADRKQRKEFVEFDKNKTPSYRKLELKRLQHLISLWCGKPIVVKLGGQTSFDIYPEGWDKTYALKHFENYNCWFVVLIFYPSRYYTYNSLMPILTGQD